MFASFERMKSVRDLILDDTQLTEYYTYHGSLTTPPCSEVVTWIDFKRSIPLSHAQVRSAATNTKSDYNWWCENKKWAARLRVKRSRYVFIERASGWESKSLLRWRYRVTRTFTKSKWPIKQLQMCITSACHFRKQANTWIVSQPFCIPTKCSYHVVCFIIASRRPITNNVYINKLCVYARVCKRKLYNSNVWILYDV